MEKVFSTKDYRKVIKYRKKNIPAEVRLSLKKTKLNEMYNYSSRVLKYDVFGRISDESYYSDKGKPVENELGYATVSYIYNDAKSEILTQYLGADGKLKDNGFFPYAIEKERYNTAGKITERSFYDSKRIPAKGVFDYCTKKINYDKQGRVTRKSYYCGKGRLLNTSEGFAYKEYKYDVKDRVITETFFNSAGDKINIKRGYAVKVLKYDQQNRLIEKHYFDRNGKPIESLTNYSSIKFAYNDTEHYREESFYDAKNKPAMIYNDYFKRREYINANKQIIEERFFDIDSSWKRAIKHKYNNSNQKIQTDYSVVIDGKKHKYATVKLKYNPQGLLGEESYYDKAGRLTENTQGYSICRRKYNNAGLLTEESFLGKNKKPKNNKYGFAFEKIIYDESFRIKHTEFYDEKNRQMDRP